MTQANTSKLRSRFMNTLFDKLDYFKLILILKTYIERSYYFLEIFLENEILKKQVLSYDSCFIFQSNTYYLKE
jgi:hypothetical protein